MAKPSAPEAGNNPPRARAWLSHPLTALFDHDGGAPAARFDVLIVGSGYGGAIAAASLAGSRKKDGERLRIAVLERGREYLPGAFPSRLSELPGHVRISLPDEAQPKGVRTGLFDLRVSKDMVSVLANGVGGGSLINAGVMLEPHERVLRERDWPEAIRADVPGLRDFYERARQWLGAGSTERPNDVRRARDEAPTKHRVMQQAAQRAHHRDAEEPAAAVAVPVTVAFEPRPSTGGVAMKACLMCGDCATGCNHEAKESLDVNLLALAEQGGVRIFTGATVRHVARVGERWSVVVVHTDQALRQRERRPLRIEADKVILAAGTFGSTEILMRSKAAGLRLSSEIGQRFSGNGDLFAAVYDMAREVRAVADESTSPAARRVGPTITAALDHRSGDPNTDVSIQELAVPGPLRQLFEEIFATARTLHSLDERDDAPHVAGEADRNAVDHAAFKRTLPIALIGRDAAKGELVPCHLDDPDGDGGVQVQWKNAGRDPRFDAHLDRAHALLASGPAGRLLPNPVWKLMSDEAARRLGLDRGPLLTVHPLGGCPMGDDVASGVVDHLGQVFDPDRPGEPYPGLVVLDGSIVPISLGINPALTIAALSLRAIEQLRDRHWGLAGAGLAGMPKAAQNPRPRPVFRNLPPAARPVATKVQIVERMAGKVRLADFKPHHVELTLHSRPVRLAKLMSPNPAHRCIRYDPGASRLRVFNKAPSPIAEEPPRKWPPAGAAVASPKTARLEARASVVKGSLRILQPEPSDALPRALRAGWRWLWHRGLRDAFQTWAAGKAGLNAPRDPMQPASSDLGSLIKNAWAIATHAGAVRTLEYTLKLGKFDMPPGRSAAILFGGAALADNARLAVRGRKRLTYDGRSSPWQQLMELTLEEFPGLSGAAPVLSLDLTYLARQSVPLLRIVSQQDHMQGLVDLASFNLYVLRTLCDGHAWSFRRPDHVPPRDVDRLPRAGRPPLHAPEIVQLPVTTATRRGAAQPEVVRLRLTRYRPRRQTRTPVVLIHGYSASGTTFAHPTLRPGLAGRLVNEGHDVWILDLRSSCGMPWADHPWTFEEIGCEDIPLAIDHVVGATGAERVDVVAHCMGSAMLWMALLADNPSPLLPDERHRGLRLLLPHRIRRIVLSQVGPFVMMSETNQARAFAMRYLEQLLPMADYRFRPDGDGSMADMLVDRLLATLPYPRAEFLLENPRRFWRTNPWVRSRRRMDALYGQVFNLANMSRETLDYLDDFFGPLNIETVSQAIHFARVRAITDAAGRHVFATRQRLLEFAAHGIDILSIHGSDNGLADVSTLDLLAFAFDPKRFQTERYEGFGHQDCLIGRNTRKIFRRIVDFLQ